jgi:hypothetical protein
MSEFLVHAIDPLRLDAIRAADCDEQGNSFTPIVAAGWEPLRCCLRLATAGESVALISYTPLAKRSPWQETGPVFVHAAACRGYAADEGLPSALRTGPRVLRPYFHDGAMAYEHIAQVGDGEDIEPYLAKILDQPDVAVVHVRAAAAQCFTYAVSPGAV